MKTLFMAQPNWQDLVEESSSKVLLPQDKVVYFDDFGA